MALFGKKDPCTICGGKVKGLFTLKIDEQPVCNACYGIVDLPDGAMDMMTIPAFKNYMQFRDENLKLKEQFNTTNVIDFGFFDTKFVFDTDHRLLCMDKSLTKTIFEGSNIRSFVIREDNSVLIEGNAEGVRFYSSRVSEMVEAMGAEISRARSQMEMRRSMERIMDMSDGKMDGKVGDGGTVRYHSPDYDIREPFKDFYVEIHLDHPYWKVIAADMSGPTFSNDYPDADDYMREYRRDTETMADLAQALKAIAFPDAPQVILNETEDMRRGVSAQNRAAQQTAPQADPVQEIQKYKALMDQGILTEEEFAVKKRQLLGL